MTVDRLQVSLSGPAMGSGVATHYAVPGSELQPAFSTFWESCAFLMAEAVDIHVPTTGDQIDEATGLLTGAWTFGIGGNYSGGGSGAYAGGVGAVIQWITQGLVEGHRVRGRTFVVPLALNSYDALGTLNASVVSALESAANVLLNTAAGNHVVWSRPRPGVAGSIHPVVDFRVSDRVSWLRSRKR